MKFLFCFLRILGTANKIAKIDREIDQITRQINDLEEVQTMILRSILQGNPQPKGAEEYWKLRNQTLNDDFDHKSNQMNQLRIRKTKLEYQRNQLNNRFE